MWIDFDQLLDLPNVQGSIIKKLLRQFSGSPRLCVIINADHS
ncbi:hypothetical protein MiTe_04442 [Microcystis aeruginosa NIES-2520]|jgi:hypothetical protein|uniref:Uncharacterized protein n=1 Tax=Microcystis aeruginosa NIES-2520 TaxID=2303982 RepID=A0A5A5RYU2_MICAE|nr:hypothetical protein MiTe_04442 [Microcystis aeruginosa NIES-2520]